MTLQIQIASDLHLEFYNNESNKIPDDIIIPKAPILALLGDIGLACDEQLKGFLYSQASRFDTVLFVAGNHEFYNHQSTLTVEQQLEWMKQVCSERDNLHFLEKQVIEINGVRILGTTLWTFIPPEHEWLAQSSMNDYRMSYKINEYNGMLRRLWAADTRQWHEESVEWLEKEIAATPPETPIIILTHHTPSMTGTSEPKHNDSDLLCCAGTDLSHLLEKPGVHAWCCGHTHYNFDFQVSGTRLVSNQRGYMEDLTVGYDPSFVLEVESSRKTKSSATEADAVADGADESMKVRPKK